MHELLLPTLYTLSGISLYAALHHGFIGMRRPIEKMHLLFALMCLTVSLYILTKAWAYKAVTVQELVEVRRWEVVLVCILFYLLPSFVARYTGVASRQLLVGLAIFWGSMLMISLLLPYGIQYVEMPTLTNMVLPWGETVLNLRAPRPGVWHNIGCLGILFVMGYCTYACYNQYRRGRSGRARNLALGLTLFFSSILFDIAVNHGYINFFHLAELGFLGLVMIMSLGLTGILRGHERRMRAVLNNVPAVVYLKDLQGRYLLVNQQYEKFFNVSNAQATGKKDSELLSSDQAETFQSNESKVLVNLHTREFEETIHLNGQPHTFQTLKFPLLDHEGAPYAICSISTDITESRHRDEEMHLLRRQIWHADRVTRTGAITASLSHELSQPLAAILSNAQAGLRFLDHDNPDMEELKALLQDIVRDDKRAGAVINGLRAMLKQQESPRENIDLSQCTQEVLELLHSEFITRTIEVEKNLTPGCTLLADKAQIQQVILNLIMNAFDAMAEHPADSLNLKVLVAFEGENKAHFSVQDNGGGIPPEILDKIFEGFYTTKAQGMGVGLAVCRSIVEAHGGNIWAQNNDSMGVTFHFTLPIDTSIKMPAQLTRKRAVKLRPHSTTYKEHKNE